MNNAILHRLRQLFFRAEENQESALEDYWQDDATLKAYDAFLARRIGWKWDAVLKELTERKLLRDAQVILDWGCGTGIASRRLAQQVPLQRILLHDRSKAAVHFAFKRHREEHALPCEPWEPEKSASVDLLLLSHVLNELDSRALAQLLKLVERSKRTLWVEPGSRKVSRGLSEIRDSLLERFHVLAPCLHQSRCPALQASSKDWCHRFARMPSEAAQDGELVRTAREIGVDLRSLPYQYLYLERKEAADLPAADEPAPVVRILGRPEVDAREIRFVGCDASGLSVQRVSKSRSPELFKAMKKRPETIWIVERDPS